MALSSMPLPHPPSLFRAFRSSGHGKSSIRTCYRYVPVVHCSAMRVLGDEIFCAQAPLLLTIGTRDEDVPPQMVQDFYEDFISERGGLTESARVE